MDSDLAAVKGVVNSLLRQSVEVAAREAATLDPSLEEFWQRIGSVVQAGGKRLRPYLVVLAYEACGGADRRAVMPVAAAWEMLHQALLIHDDIIDHDTWRHGQPNVTGIYREEYERSTGQPQLAAADATALLAGDLLLAAAQQFILNSDVPVVMKPGLAKLLTYAYQATCYGELLEVQAVFRSVAATEPLRIAELKTAYYSVSGPLQSGALLAGASNKMLDQWAELGQLLGLAFQLTDDLLGVFGNEDTTGKSATNDLEEAKRTRLLLLTYEQLGEADQRRLIGLLTQPSLSKDDIAVIRALMLASGAVDTLGLEIGRYMDQARVIVDELTITPEARQRLHDLIELLAERQF